MGRLYERHSVFPKLREYPELNRALAACWEESRGAIPKKAPARVVLVLSEESMQTMWIERLVRWCYYFQPAMLASIGRALIKERKIMSRQKEYLRELKNTGDDLRNFFTLFSVAHQIPLAVQMLVKIVGQLRDQVRLGEFKRAKHTANELLGLLAKAGKIDWPALRVDPKEMCEFLAEIIAGMKESLAREKMTGFEFHQIKKDFRLLFSVFYFLYPKAARLPEKRNAFLATKTVIKKMHLVLLQNKYAEGFKYRKMLVTVPLEFRTHVLRFISAIQILTLAPAPAAVAKPGKRRPAGQVR